MNTEEIQKTINQLYNLDVLVEEYEETTSGHFIIYADSSKGSIVIKLFSSDIDLNRLYASLLWQLHLSKNGINTPELFLSKSNNLYETISLDNQTRIVTVMQKINGQSLNDKTLDQKIIAQIGSKTARMHGLVASFEKENPRLVIPEWHEDPYVSIGEQIKSNPALSAASQKLISEIKNIVKTENTYGLIHSDLQPHNMIMSNSGLYVIDFEALTRHWFIVDFISTLEGYIGNIDDKGEYIQMTKLFTRAYFSGYFKHKEMAIDLIEKIPIFYRLWEIILYNDLVEKWDMENLSAKRMAWMKRNEKDIILGNRFETVNFANLVDSI